MLIKSKDPGKFEYAVTPQILSGFKTQVIDLLQKRHRDLYLIDVFALSGTSLCGETEVLLAEAKSVNMLFPVIDGDRLVAVSDRGAPVGYMPSPPILVRAVKANRDVFMYVEYSDGTDGIPQIIVSLWTK